MEESEDEEEGEVNLQGNLEGQKEGEHGENNEEAMQNPDGEKGMKYVLFDRKSYIIKFSIIVLKQKRMVLSIISTTNTACK